LLARRWHSRGRKLKFRQGTSSNLCATSGLVMGARQPGRTAGLSPERGASPEDLFISIGRLRIEARREIDRLIQFLDKTDDYVSRELEDDDDREEVDDAEPSLGSFDRMTNQDKAWRTQSLWAFPEVDGEVDDADREDDDPDEAKQQTTEMIHAPDPASHHAVAIALHQASTSAPLKQFPGGIHLSAGFLKDPLHGAQY
jgi:hypothetical protein